MEYTINETKSLLQGIQDGAQRTATIVKDLKSFSRLDENTMKKSDLHEGIDSTLSLLQYKYKDKINVIKEYGDIPDIDCDPGKINQVFMNIISNAIDAFPDHGKNDEIRIKTKKVEDTIQISIEDNGLGISHENVKKIFDPFFTTKDVGKGTGLGLSISSSIISDHHGTIDVKSEPGKGSIFTITLPITQIVTDADQKK
jgi:signal transduction histidine kinase